MVKPIKEGLSYSNREIIDLLIDFSSYKDRVEKKFKEITREFDGKPNEHELWVNLYMIATDYYEEITNKKLKNENTAQKVS